MNLFDYFLPERGKERFTELFNFKNVVINRIVSNNIVNGEWYEQAEDEWLVLLEGDALLEFEDEEKSLRQGETLFIPAGRRHFVKSSSEKTVWLTVHIH
ncbi:MAG: cupin domain-containing protein [Thiovulaceae bacterium]|nr:cupin domain-containing protein [Sulfurimonadaceae bacterium]